MCQNTQDSNLHVIKTKFKISYKTPLKWKPKASMFSQMLLVEITPGKWPTLITHSLAQNKQVPINQSLVLLTWHRCLSTGKLCPWGSFEINSKGGIKLECWDPRAVRKSKATWFPQGSTPFLLCPRGTSYIIRRGTRVPELKWNKYHWAFQLLLHQACSTTLSLEGTPQKFITITFTLSKTVFQISSAH